MNLRRSLLLLPLAGLVVFAGGAAPPPAPHAARAEPEDLARWQWVFTVPVTQPGKLTDFVVPPAVFGRAQEDLADLRLTDARGRPIPYDLRVRRPVDTQDPVPGQPFDKLQRADRSASLSLDLGPGPVQHNEVEVNVPGRAYARPLVVEGSDDGKTWSRLLGDVYLVRLDVGGRAIQENRFRYPVSRLRYVRVTVRPDRVLEGDEPGIDSARLFRTVQVPGELVTTKAVLLPREAGRHHGSFASSWRIDLGEKNVPVSKLLLTIDDDSFSRAYTLETLRPADPTDRLDRDQYTFVASGQIHRAPRQPRRPIEIDVPGEARARWLKLTVVDDRNPPLNLEAVSASAPARQVVFVPPDGPLRLYAGNPTAGRPNYDFAATLPARLDPPPLRTSVGPAEENPAYVPEPKPFTERWPYLVDAVLAAAALALVGILAVLARSAVRRHDEAEGSAAPA